MPSDAMFARQLLGWYDRARRALPWRNAVGGGASPYAVLVSELMLQQTQVATVIPYFQRFMERFPTPAILADAPEQEVLRLWQGLGYYSRARNLHAAAKRIVSNFGGIVPRDLEQLRSLPGVGRYTAGAIASIAFNQPAPIVDGNVARVICRLDKIEHDPRQPKILKQLWARAEQILPDQRIAEFNSAMMELGATVCTPRTPKCLLCPVQKFCRAFAAGVQDSIPPARKARPTPLVKRWTLCVQHEDRWLIEKRPATGRWAQLWQFITIEPSDKNPTSRHVRQHVGCRTGTPKSIGHVRHALTHRRYEFSVFIAQTGHADLKDCDRPRRWIHLDDLHAYPLSRPQLKIAEILRERSQKSLP